MFYLSITQKGLILNHGLHKCVSLQIFQVYLTVCLFLGKENRIYIRVEFTRKKCKTAILLYCFHTAGVLHIFALYNLFGPGTSFHIDSMPFTLQAMIFRYNYKSNDVFIHLINLIKFI